MGTHSSPVPGTSKPKIWWSNSIFFLAVHIAAAIGLYFRPFSSVPRATILLFFFSWQLADFGITVGYHRLYSHRAFRASFGVRIILAVLGSAGFQGSIKIDSGGVCDIVYITFTDDPVHDPYAATRGLFYSHMGWIFFKPTYERMELVDREDLDSDPVVRFQHQHYVSLALFFGFVLPPLLGSLWGDAWGAFIWGGLLARLAIWHCTFMVNSLAHWDGLQPYSDENTSRGNLILALLTGGEGNHNFHAFPHDFRSGPMLSEWDPSKWIILALHRLGLATGLRRARDHDLKDAITYMHHKNHGIPQPVEEQWKGDVWNAEKAAEFISRKRERCIILVDGFFVDATGYLAEHPGGSIVLRKYSLRMQPDSTDKTKWQDASWAFDGGLNNHSRAAKVRMRQLRLAKLDN